MTSPASRRRPLADTALDLLERAGNGLPHPVTLFFLCASTVLVASSVLDAIGFRAVHPGTGQEIGVVNLLSGDGIRRILTGMVDNFTSFVPLGTVLVALLGVGVAEGSGLISAVLRAVVLAAPRRLVTAVVVFAGIASNAASDVGYVVLIPLGAMVFQAFGRHPLAGLAAAFAGVSGGFSANVILGTIDPLLAGITQEMAMIIDASYRVSPAANYYFMIASTGLLVVIGTLVTERIVEPRLRRYGSGDERPTIQPLMPAERRALLVSALAMVAAIGVVALLVIPEGAVLRDPTTGGLLHSPFLEGIVPIMLVLFLVPGVTYGLMVRVFTSDAKVVGAMVTSMNTMGSYIVLVFFAAQFVAFFNWTKIGLITAIKGAELFQSIGLEGLPLILVFVLVAAVINLLVGSASAKWAIIAPIFVPMFMLLGISPELTQAAYRVGDSVTNLITPMMSYFAMILTFAQRYDTRVGLGTLIATMMPYTVAFLLGWMVLLCVWVLVGLPLGPGAPLFLP